MNYRCSAIYGSQCIVTVFINKWYGKQEKQVNRSGNVRKSEEKTGK